MLSTPGVCDLTTGIALDQLNVKISNDLGKYKFSLILYKRNFKLEKIEDL